MTRIAALRSWFEGHDCPLVALSGGVDSALVAHAAHSVTPRAIAFTADYQALPREDLEAARKTCDEIGIEHMVVQYDELLNESYATNTPDRCFHCRTELGERLVEAARRVTADVIVDGTHLDDMGDYRPGLEAMRAAGVRSPLAESGLTKDDVRECARAVGLSACDRPANSCLASRIPWGRRVTAKRLARIELAERIVRQATGIGIVRVRDTGDETARIEVPHDSIGELRRSMDSQISPRLRTLGYLEVSVSERGYSQGGANAGAQ